MTDPATGVREATTPYASAPPALSLADTPRTLEGRTGLVGRSRSMRLLREQIARFAPTTATVVVLGETGTGKELVARALHAGSRRARMPFVAANVAAIPSSTLMSELFGHERGAFTGACLRHKGLFEQAHGGTLFLDEVGELDLDAYCVPQAEWTVDREGIAVGGSGQKDRSHAAERRPFQGIELGVAGRRVAHTTGPP